ncbi:DUF1761 domain-containing protein [Yoonia sp. R2331]|uniref:DUF1761 domain-containing protein n=1 Tax=Yoonia sp. R2331 TaxID=3237238 RepID=UPI0034E5D5EA
MTIDVTPLNWPAVIAGTIAAFILGMLWFSPKLFGKAWSTGSHNIQPPDSPPVLAMVVQLLGTFALALVVGLTETYQAIGAALAAITATALLIAGMDLFSQKTVKATLVDATYIIAAGVLMILAQGVL